MPSLFRDANGSCLPVGCHLGDGLSRYARGHVAEVGALLDAIAGAGYAYVRTWTVLGGAAYWAGREVGPQAQGDAYWGIVAHYAAELEARGLRWLVSQGDMLRIYPTTAGRMAFVERLIDTLRNERETLAGWDLGNESGNNGESDPAKLEALSWPVASAWPDLALSLSSSQTEEVAEINALSPKPCTVFDVHGYRGGHWWDKVRHIFSIAYEGKPNRHIGIQSEPFGPGAAVSASENKHELTPDVMQAAAVMSLMSRQSWCYFCGAGIKGDEGEALTDAAGFAETPATGAMLPKDIMAADLFHGGNTWAAKRVFAAVNETRCDHAVLPDGRGACLIYGPSWSEVATRTPQRAVSIVSDHAFGTSARLVQWRA
jgi:hypothetical protein